jgi:hypothetical protein
MEYENAATESSHFNETEELLDIQHCPLVESSVALHDIIIYGFDVMIVISVAVNAFLLVTVLSSRQLRRGASAGLVIGLTTSDMLGILCNRINVEILMQYSMHPAANALCKVSTFLLHPTSRRQQQKS